MLSAPVRRFLFASGVLVCVLSAFAFFSQQVSLKKPEAAVVAPSLSATKTAAILMDANSNGGVVNPGDSLRYTVTINNKGADPATGVAINDTIDANTTLIGGSVIASPIAVNDAFTSIGNVGINVPAGNGLLANDLDANNPGSPNLSIAVVNAAGLQETAKVNTTTGAFTYNPPVGFEGADTQNRICLVN